MSNSRFRFGTQTIGSWALMLGCGVSLSACDMPGGACVQHSDCVSGYECRAGYCQAPIVEEVDAGHDAGPRDAGRRDGGGGVPDVGRRDAGSRDVGIGVLDLDAGCVDESDAPIDCPMTDAGPEEDSGPGTDTGSTPDAGPPERPSSCIDGDTMCQTECIRFNDTDCCGEGNGCDPRCAENESVDLDC